MKRRRPNISPNPCAGSGIKIFLIQAESSAIATIVPPLSAKDDLKLKNFYLENRAQNESNYYTVLMDLLSVYKQVTTYQ